MYIPKQFEQPQVEIMHELMRARPLATLVTLASGGLDANHIPLLLSDAPAPFGTLRGHVARANPLWRDFAKDIEVLAIFHGPDAYITPSWYATKQETGKVAPPGISRSSMPTARCACLTMRPGCALISKRSPITMKRIFPNRGGFGCAA